MSQPQVPVPDEPSLGLSPALVNRVYHLLADLNRSGLAMLVAEQNVAMALDVAASAYVLELGRIVAEGPVRHAAAFADAARSLARGPIGRGRRFSNRLKS